MSGSLIGGIVGAGIGLIVSGGNPMGALYGWSAGSVAGGLLFPQHVDGPRLSDLKVQSSEYGRPIPIVYGTVALGGNVIWASDYVEEKGDSGGKGGPSVTTYTYYGNFAIAFCEGEADILRMWAGPEKRLIWDGAKLEGNGKVRIYKGTEDQLPDPLIESYLGVGNVPAYRGTTYVVFEHFPLEKDGNTLPFITAEVDTTGRGVFTCPVPASTVTANGQSYSIFDPAPEKVADIGSANATYGRAFYDDSTGLIYYTYRDTSNQWWLDRIDPKAGRVGDSLFLAASNGVLNIASDNNGSAAFLIENSVQISYVSLSDWAIYKTETKKQTICLGDHCIDYIIEMADVVSGGAGGQWIFLGESNMLNAITYGLPTEKRSDYAWGSGERFGGNIFPIGPGAIYGHAVENIAQPSDYATDADVYWGAFDTKRHILVSFQQGVYNHIDTNTYVNTSDFGDILVGEGAAIYNETTDRFYVASGNRIYIYDPEKLTPQHWPREACTIFDGFLYQQAFANGEPIVRPYAPMRLVSVSSDPMALYVLTAAGQMMRIRLDGVSAISGRGVTLASVVADLSDRAGMPHYDVGQLTADIVDGYTIARQTTVRNAIDALRPAYLFDAVESEGKVKFVKRGGAPVATIDVDDLDARGDGQGAGDPLLTTRQMEVELPRVVNINYMLAATDYSPATKLAKRLVGASGSETTLDLPLVLTDTKAQEVADVNLQLSWVQRLTYSFSLPRKYSELEPTDHIVVKGNGMRLTKATRTPQGVIKCEAVADGSTYYTPNTTVTETPPTQQTVNVPGTTLLELM